METMPTGPSGETIDTPRHRALGSDSRVTILRAVRAADGGLTAADVAAGTGQHLSTTRTHLERLVEAGLLVKARASGGLPGRPAWRYRATGDGPVPAPYRSLTVALLEHLAPVGGDVREAAGRIGQDWGRHLAAADPDGDDPIAAVTRVLDGLGFDPAVQPDPGDGRTRVHLHTCPFLDLVGQNPDAMCGLHAGVIRGVLEQRGAPAGETILEPFGAPTACVVHLPRLAPADPDGTR
nr:ArsR family transcriptional regulator [Actinoplanes derwentensis]